MKSLFTRIVTELSDDITPSIKWSFISGVIPVIIFIALLGPIIPPINDYERIRVVGSIVIGAITSTALAIYGTMSEVWNSKTMINTARNGLIAGALTSLLFYIWTVGFMYFLLRVGITMNWSKAPDEDRMLVAQFLRGATLVLPMLTLLLAVTGWLVGIFVARLRQRKDSKSF